MAQRAKASIDRAEPAHRPAAAAPDLDPERLFGAIDFSARASVVVAVSGGSDSLSLLFLLKRHLDADGPTVRPIAVTIDHRLRPESAAEAARVGGIAGRLGIEHRVVAWEEPKPATGVSAAAREARHRLLAGAAREAGTNIVLTGHTMNDQAETVAMRQQRGGGRGEAGIAAATLYDGSCWFVRPLLGTRRAALRRFLTASGQDWIDDPSNIDRRYERARLRKALSDEKAETLARQAADAAARREALGRRAAALIAEHTDMPSAGLMRLDPALVGGDDREAVVYALRILLAAVGGREHLPEEERVAALLGRLTDETGRTTLSRCLVERRRGEIFVRRERRGKEGGAAPPPTLGPWARYLPSFDLAPAAALARLLGMGEIPPPPLAGHNHPKA